VKNPLVALDVLAIQQLLARYCVYLDQRDFDTWSTIWAPEGEMHAFGQIWKGPEEITSHISQSDHGLHMAGIPQILIDGDRATGLQNFLFAEAAKTEAGWRELRIGYYDDEFVRLDEGWHFASRKIIFIKAPKPA
jgi:3-phenylpropionate/cinnamic acid dioxygenase small subunit